MLVDPLKSLMGLAGSYPGTTIDACGAGDHLDKVDSKIRRVKETMRSVIAGLPYQLSRARIKDLATYAVSRLNIRKTAALTDNVCPRVKFTGVKVDFKKEFGLAFGDYVGAYNPRAENRSNNTLVARSEPCIALYPSANKNISWMMYSLVTKAMEMSEVVIKQKNEAAGATGVVIADITGGGAGNDAEGQHKENPVQMHVPPTDIGVSWLTNEEAELAEDLPELIPQGDEVESDDGANEKMMTFHYSMVKMGMIVMRMKLKKDHLGLQQQRGQRSLMQDKESWMKTTSGIF